MQYLGFGEFVFRLPDGKEIGKASNLREMEDILPTIPDESVFYHATHNHFSSWLMARAEIMLASKIKPVKISDFESIGDAKQYLVSIIHDRRTGRQKGIITEFDSHHFDPDADFSKIGKGSLGGKARGLAFMSTRLKNSPEFLEKFKDVDIAVPQTLVVSTEAFDSFISENNLRDVASGEFSDAEIIRLFTNAQVPEWLKRDLERLEINDAVHDAPVRHLCSTYLAQDHRIRDGVQASGYPVCTFANILKYQSFPLAEILRDLLRIGRVGMGCPVEIEFAVKMPFDEEQKPLFELLQIRPMAVNQYNLEIEISAEDISNAFCYSTMALGNGQFKEIEDIIFVNPDSFDAADTIEIAAEIGNVNKEMAVGNRKYLLIGPGRWGSADRWLGIPVRWTDISGVGAIVETTIEGLKADPSQGSHFFHNITSLGISYLNTSEGGEDFIDWKWLRSLSAIKQTPHLKHVVLKKPLTIKINGKRSRAVIIA